MPCITSHKIQSFPGTTNAQICARWLALNRAHPMAQKSSIPTVTRSLNQNHDDAIDPLPPHGNPSSRAAALMFAGGFVVMLALLILAQVMRG